MVLVKDIALAILCFLGLGCGLSFSILVTMLMNLIEDRFKDGHPALHVVTPIAWMIGLAYIIPGLVGMIACCVRRKRMVRSLFHSLIHGGVY